MTPAGEESSRAISRTRVLVVEDDPDVRDLIRRVLEAEGLTVETAVDGWQALARTVRRRPSLVVLDLMLPRLDGDEVAAALRMSHDPEIPILVVSGRADVAEKARRAGARGYLEKPFRTDDLVAAVRSALDPRSADGTAGRDGR